MADSTVPCRTGKFGHLTRRAAMAVLKRTVRAGKRKPDGLEAYRCSRCGLWHIGNSGNRPRRTAGKAGGSRAAQDTMRT